MNDSPLRNRFALPAPWGRRVGLVLTLLGGVALGALLFGGEEAPPPPTAGHEHGPAGADEEPTEWTCSMHPQVRLPGPGQCPICFMDLIPVKKASGNEAPHELVLTEAARSLAQVRTEPVRRAPAQRELDLVGRVTYDETLVRRVSSFVPGRIERLYVEVTGTRVNRGEHLLRIYSPELLGAQTEWVDTLKQVSRVPAGSAARSVLEKTAAAAEERLRLWGLSPRQLDRLRQGGAPQEMVTVYAPQGGVVVEREAVVGMYVKEGTPLYTVAELDRLWVELDAYERDLPHIRFGQTVTLQTDAMPGRSWPGRVVFIAPVVDERTRTVRVRVNVTLEDPALKPGMLVRATLLASVDKDGHAVSEGDLAGMYVCPMHPDVVKDHPGTCDVCGMALESAESLGLVHEGATELPLLIPATAPLLTGKRAVVYVEVAGRDQPTYEGRVVELGPRVGDRYVVLSGLSEGEPVVVEGAFKLDAAMQVHARPSMMSFRPDEEPGDGEGTLAPPPASSPEPAPFRNTKAAGSSTTKAPASAATGPRGAPPAAKTADLGPVVDAYLSVKKALTATDPSATRAAAGALQRSVRELYAGSAPASFVAQRPALTAAVEAMAAASDVAGARTAFAPTSAALITALDGYGAPGPRLYKFFCPMALKGKGATWLQTEADLENPYFGAKMLKCGEGRGVIEPRGSKGASRGSP